MKSNLKNLSGNDLLEQDFPNATIKGKPWISAHSIDGVSHTMDNNITVYTAIKTKENNVTVYKIKVEVYVVESVQWGMVTCSDSPNKKISITLRHEVQ